MIKDDGTVIHFNNPKVQASLSANTFAITGHAETKQLTEMLPGILSQLGADSLTSLRKLAEQFPRQGGWEPCTVERCGFFFFLYSLDDLFFFFLFKVLDNKAPKAEDIDEEDDDVPGRIFQLSVLWNDYFVNVHAPDTFSLLSPDLVENFDEASKNEANWLIAHH